MKLRLIPPPLTVTVPLLLVVAVFAVVVSVKLPLPDPLVVLIFTHVGRLTVHAAFDVTLTTRC